MLDELQLKQFYAHLKQVLELASRMYPSEHEEQEVTVQELHPIVQRAVTPFTV